MISGLNAANGREPGTQTHHHLSDNVSGTAHKVTTKPSQERRPSVTSRLEDRCEDFLALAIQKTARHHEGFPRQPYEAVDPVDHSGSSSATE